MNTYCMREHNIAAVQWDGDNLDQVMSIIRTAYGDDPYAQKIEHKIIDCTLLIHFPGFPSAHLHIDVGEYIAFNHKAGLRVVCEKDFEKHYLLVNDPDPMLTIIHEVRRYMKKVDALCWTGDNYDQIVKFASCMEQCPLEADIVGDALYITGKIDHLAMGKGEMLIMSQSDHTLSSRSKEEFLKEYELLGSTPANDITSREYIKRVEAVQWNVDNLERVRDLVMSAQPIMKPAQLDVSGGVLYISETMDHLSLKPGEILVLTKIDGRLHKEGWRQFMEEYMLVPKGRLPYGLEEWV